MSEQPTSPPLPIAPTPTTVATPTLQPAAEQSNPSAAVSQPLPKRQSIKERLQTNNVLELLFRIGFASIFLTNAWVALAHPGSFLDLVEGNFASRLVGHYSLQVYAIAINDGLLGLLVLSGIKKKYVYAWAGVWLLIVTFFKITSLV